MKKYLTLLLCALTCCCSFMLCSCGEKIEKHVYFITSENERLGVVCQGGTYLTNEEFEITAQVKDNAPENTEFIAWIKDGIIVSYDNPYKIVASKESEGKYTAVFSYEYLKLVQLLNISLEEEINPATEIINISKIKVYLDNKEYFQPSIFNDDSVSLLQQPENKISMSKEIEPYYVYNRNEYFYGSIEVTYAKSETEFINKITYFRYKNIDIEAMTITIPLNKPENIEGDETLAGNVILTFQMLTQPSIEE